MLLGNYTQLTHFFILIVNFILEEMDLSFFNFMLMVVVLVIPILFIFGLCTEFIVCVYIFVWIGVVIILYAVLICVIKLYFEPRLGTLLLVFLVFVIGLAIIIVLTQVIALALNMEVLLKGWYIIVWPIL